MNFLDTPTEITIGSLLLAIILTIVAYFIILADKKVASFHLTSSVLTHCMGKPHWDFSKSWATSLTAVGALLGTVLAAAGGGLTSDKTNAGLNVFFGVLVLIAPLLYSATARYTETGPKDTTEGQAQGYVGMFLLSSLLTVWAVWGELITVLIILYNLSATTIVTSPIRYIFLVFLVAALVCVGVYALRTIPWTVQDQLLTEKQETERLQARAAPGETLQPPLKDWSLL